MENALRNPGRLSRQGGRAEICCCPSSCRCGLECLKKCPHSFEKNFFFPEQGVAEERSPFSLAQPNSTPRLGYFSPLLLCCCFLFPTVDVYNSIGEMRIIQTRAWSNWPFDSSRAAMEEAGPDIRTAGCFLLWERQKKSMEGSSAGMRAGQLYMEGLGCENLRSKAARPQVLP